MLPNINRNGSSFRGAGAYHLHDKGDKTNSRPTTSERVAWTATRNLANDDPQKALDEMWHTAEDAAHLKQASGHEWRRRREAMPVKTMSLSWAPHQSPTRQEMEAAADSFLTHMGWQQHQALLLAHTDTAHPHLHIILNRVHPETGLVLNDWREQQRSQRWGDRYDKEQGLILCHARADKYEKGLDLAPDGMPYPYAKLMQEQERAFDNPLAQAAVQDLQEKDLLARHHQEEREAFLGSGKAQFRQVRQEAYREVRDQCKPLWREHFQRAEEGRDQLEQQTRIAHRDAVRLAREGDHEAATLVLTALDEQRDAVHAQLSAERKELRQHQLETTRHRQDEACRALIEDRAEGFQEIKDRQKDERAEFKVLQALRDAGQPYDLDRMQELLGQHAPPALANDNRQPIELAEPANQNRPERELALLDANPFSAAARDLFPEHVDPQEKAPHRDASDLAAGVLGAAVEIGIRLMEGFIAPPTPRERAIEKARAIRQEQLAPARETALEEEKIRNDFTRHAATAAREAEAEQEQERKLYWEERGRSRSRER
jgi:hypothetical protein